MSIGKRSIFIIMVLVMVLIGACDSDPTPTSPVGSSSGDSGSESSSDGDTGSASIIYDYIIDHPVTSLSIHAEIPVTISPPAGGDIFYKVKGKMNTNYFAQMAGGAGGIQCHVSCEVPAEFHADGKLFEMNDGEDEDVYDECTIAVTISNIPKPENSTKSGDCPAAMIEAFACAQYALVLNDTRIWEFTADKPLIPIPSDQGVTLKAEIKNVKMPSGVDCEWGD